MPGTHTQRGVRSLGSIGMLLAGMSAGAVTAQSVGWVPVRQVSVETAPYSSGRMTTTDFARGLIVSFGCHRPENGIADTWEWGGSHWTPRDPARLPAWRQDAMFVHDPLRGRAVMFGGAIGTVGSYNTNQTWEWDGETWVLRTLSGSPSARSGCAGAYDAARGRIVMFGGYNQSDTWEYDGTAWTQRAPANAPSARGGHGMVYDEVRQRVLLHGGQVAGVANGETWEWDGTDWSFVTIGPPVKDHTMVRDRSRNRTVVVGYPPFQGWGTYEWNGASWSLVTSNLPFRYDPKMVGATDPGFGGAVVFAQGTRWLWSGAAWQAAGSTHRTPRGRFPAPHCVDSLRNRVVFYSSDEGTWEWDGTGWTLGAYGPGHKYAAMAFDSSRGRSVMFGGQASNGVMSNATFEWNGSVWTQPTFASQPSPRASHAMAYDAARQRIVMFGGVGVGSMSQPAPIFGDTWTYDGIAWTLRASGGPSARVGHQMAYDTVRQVVVMVGGGDQSGFAAPTVWEWNGSSWAQSAPAVFPPLRSTAAMAFDPIRSAVVLFGGASASATLNDTWSWDGTSWTQINTVPAVAARYAAGLEFDPVRQQLLLFGGFLPQYPNAYQCCERIDMAVLQTSPVAPMAATVGTGCSAGTPPRLGSSTPYLGNDDFAIELLGAAPAVPGVVGLAFGLQAQPLGACTFYLQGVSVLVTVLTNPFGAARVALPLPSTPSLVGAQLVAQGASLATPGGFAGFDLTAARTVQLGH